MMVWPDLKMVIQFPIHHELNMLNSATSAQKAALS